MRRWSWGVTADLEATTMAEELRVTADLEATTDEEEVELRATADLEVTTEELSADHDQQVMLT